MGYGSSIFDFFEKAAEDKDYTSIIVYIDNEFDSAIKLYLKNGMIKEYYNNDLESDEINNETIIFSESLIFKRTEKRNNKFL